MSMPSSYSEWVNLLDKFGNGDDTVLNELSKLTFTIDNGTALRFYSNVEGVYKKRKQHWLDQFQRLSQMHNFKADGDFEIILRNGKKNLYPLTMFVALNGLPNDLREILKKDLEDFVGEIKNSLRDNISKISSNREKMLILLNNFVVSELPKNNEIDKKENRHDRSEIISSTGRQIIF